jgi:hypothetical protein
MLKIFGLIRKKDVEGGKKVKLSLYRPRKPIEM